MNDSVFDKLASLAADEREAFRAGYLARLAAAGVSPGEFEEELVKRAGAFDDFSKMLGWQKITGWLGSPLSSTAGAVLWGAPVALGGIAGWAAANALNPSDKDLEMLEDEALANEYRHQTNRLLAEAARSRRPAGKARSVGL
jgi:hypothetical protein